MYITSTHCTPFVVQETDAVGLLGGEGLDRAIQLKKSLLEFDQTRYVWNAKYACTCMCTHTYMYMYHGALTISGMVCPTLAAACLDETNESFLDP